MSAAGRAAAWWCEALRGYARHHLQPGSGGPHFDSAYLSAPAGTPAWADPAIAEAGDRGLHCEWADLGYLLAEAPLASEEGFVNGGYSFAPDARRSFDPIASTADDWAVSWNEGHERMITSQNWHNLRHHQVAVLHRGEGLLAVAAAQLPVLVSSLDGVEAALAMGRPADLRTHVVSASVDASGTVRARTELEAGDWVASLETRGDAWVGRARYGAPAPTRDEHGFGVSAPALVHERFTPDALQLSSALLPTTDLLGYDGVGVYFEVYGLGAGEEVRLRLTGKPLGVERSLLGRIAETLGVGSRPAPLRIEWSESADTATPGRTERHLLVDLRGLGSGEYELSLEVERRSGALATASRTLRLTRYR